MWSIAIDKSVTAYREASKEYIRDRIPLNWVMTLNNLGDALRIFGERESGTARLEEAIAAYREALTIFDTARASFASNVRTDLQHAQAEFPGAGRFAPRAAR